MMAAKFIFFVLLFVVCSYASPLRTATMYGFPVFVVPVFVQDLDIPQSAIDEDALNNSKIAEDTANSIEKRSVEETDDLETAAGTNVLRPLFVYRQQIAYRQRARENAIRRGRRI
nr:PREDICTED: uncharacterized protein LOC105677747 [Linepithema humile]